MRSAKVAYYSARPDRAVTHSSLTKLRVHQTVKLLIYATFRGIVSSEQVVLGFRVTKGGATTFFKRVPTTVTSGSDNRLLGFWTYYQPTQTGKFSYSGTLHVGGKHQHKTVFFSVTH